MNSHLVSIIIPVFNRELLIEKTLRSIINQTYLNWECIIVDDCSTDSTFETLSNYAKKDARFKIYKRPLKNKKGPSACRNYGLNFVKGSFVIFLDSDDILADFCLKTRVNIALQFNNYDLWIFRTKVFTTSILKATNVFNLEMPVYNDFNYLALFYQGKYPFCISSPMWKTQSLKKINGFDENLLVFEDPDFHIRAFNNNLKSVTFSNLEADNYYRIDANKLNEKRNKIFLKKAHHSAYIFIKKHLELNKNKISKFALFYFRDEILHNAQLKITLKFYFLYLFKNLFKLNQMLLVPFLITLSIFNLQDKKGYGFYRVDKLIFKKINQ